MCAPEHISLVICVSPQRWRPVICVSPPPLPYKVQIPAQIMLFTAKANSKQLKRNAEIGEISYSCLN